MFSFPHRSVSELRPVRKKVTWQVIHFHVEGVATLKTASGRQARRKVKGLIPYMEMRINEQITVIVRRHSAAMVGVYRHGVLVWKAGEPSGVSTGPGMRHSGESTGLGIRNGVTQMMDNE